MVEGVQQGPVLVGTFFGTQTFISPTFPVGFGCNQIPHGIFH